MSLSLRHSVALVAAFLVASCGLFQEVDETKGWSAQKLYAEAKRELDGGNYENAIKLYQKIEARYPHGRFAQQAQLEIAYAYYKDEQPAEAIATAERFMKMHPNHPNVDYAYYLRGLCNFNGDLGWLGWIGGQDMSERDPKAASEAFMAFKELAKRYPKSKYTPDAVQRMKYLVNTLAEHEVHVARYYMRRGAYLAAANRAQFAVKTYPQAPATEEGLAIMVRAYNELEMWELKNDAERVLMANFPNSPYRKGEVKKDVPWWQIWNK